MVEASYPRASRTYFAYEDASVQDIKACARAAALRAIPRKSLADILSLKSRLQAFGLKLVARALVGEKAHEGMDIGTVHMAHWVPFENNHIGFFTIFDGDFKKYIQDFAKEISVAFDTIFPHVSRAANPSGEERPGLLSVGIGQQPATHRVLQRLSRRLGSRHSSSAGRSPGTATIGQAR